MARQSIPSTGRRPAAGRRADHSADRVELAAVRYLAARERSEAQLKAHLAKVGATPARIRALTTLFRARGYLDDAALAMRMCRSRLARRPVGRARLEAELARRGVDAAVVRQTLDLVYGEAGEEPLAARLLRASPPRGRADLARRIGLLRRSGFSEETIENVLGRESDW
jgi:regulatory protein